MASSSAFPSTVRGTNVAVSPSGAVDMNALIANTVDRVTGFYYYTLELAAGQALAPSYNLFNAAVSEQDPYSLSTNSQVLTKVKTNILTRASQGFAPPYDIVVDSIGIEIDPLTNPADIALLMRYSYFELAILQKIQWEGKIQDYPAGVGITGATSQNAQSMWNIGTADPNAKKRFGRYGKYLAPQVMWSWTLNFPANNGPVVANVPTQPTLLTAANSGVGAVLRFYLFGLLDRPVT